MVKHRARVLTKQPFPEWVEGLFIDSHSGAYIVNPENFIEKNGQLLIEEFHEVNPKTVVRWSEKFDKTGTCIYDRDIVKISDDEGFSWVGIVEVKDGTVTAYGKHRSVNWTFHKELKNVEIMNDVDGLEELLNYRKERK